MFVPFITSRNSQPVYRRKGGGGKGGGKGGSSGSDSGGSSGSSGSSGSKGGSSGTTSSSTGKGAVNKPVSGSTGGTSRTSSAYGSGGGSAVTIPSGQLFAGRSSGGGTRSQVYGTRHVSPPFPTVCIIIHIRDNFRTYGSGYPGVNNRGVGGLGFPFIFWPIIWGGSLGYGAAYLHDSSEVRQLTGHFLFTL